MSSNFTPVVSLTRQTEQMLAVTISKVGHPKLEVTKGAFKELELILRDRRVSHFMVRHVDALLSMVVTQMRYLLPQLSSAAPSERQNLGQAFASIARLLKEIFIPRNAAMTSQVSKGTIRDLVYILMTTMIDTDLNLLPNGHDIFQCSNILVLQIIQTSEPCAVICGLIGLLNFTLRQTINVKLKELVLKCESQLLKLFSRWADEGKSMTDGQLENIIREFHSFNHHHPLILCESNEDVMATKLVKNIMIKLIQLVSLQRVNKALLRMKDLEGTTTLTIMKKLCKRSGEKT